MKTFKFKKKYGQNFLIDENILNMIISSVSPTDKDLIIEIGAGTGNLTKHLKKYGSKIIAFEIDRETQNYLDKLKDEKTTVVYDDFLKINLNKMLKNIDYKDIYVIANLPYYITTPIIEKIIIEKIYPKKMILMVQKEVADRLASSPKSKAYGYITVYLNYYFKISKLFNVGKSAFLPSPNVESAVISLESHDIYQCKNEERFVNLIKDAFKQKRKNLNNNLKNYNKELIQEILMKNGLSLSSRAEEVPVIVFIEIANAL